MIYHRGNLGELRMTTNDTLTTRLHAADNVVVARTDILPGMENLGENLRAVEHIPAGHKIATAPVAAGEPLRKYDQIIGFAPDAIAPGDHVHTHNVKMKDFARDYAAGTETRDTAYVAEAGRASFMGYKRTDGQVGTRNYIGVLSTVNCSATVARYVSERYRGDALDAYPNVDGVVAITHGTGCSLDGGSEGMALLRRTLAGYARHPNCGGIIFLGLGCEVAQIGQFVAHEGLEVGPLLHAITIQDTGGTTATIAAACERIDAMLPEIDKARRSEQVASELILGFECGGSDAYSGISANPSLGAAAKGTTTNLTAVYRYAEPVTAMGFVFMDTPCYDPVSVTGMVAGGANMVCFTTGRGSVFGCKPVPSIKLATNTTMYERMADDMDINCGPVVDGAATVAKMGEHIFHTVLHIASGAPSKSEALGFGDDEFVPWQIGAVM